MDIWNRTKQSIMRWDYSLLRTLKSNSGLYRGLCTMLYKLEPQWATQRTATSATKEEDREQDQPKGGGGYFKLNFYARTQGPDP